MKLFVSIFALLLFALSVQSPAFAGQSEQPPTASTANASTPAYTLPADKLARAVAFAHAKTRLHFIDVIYGILILWLMLQFAVTAHFRNWAKAVSRRRFVQAIIFFPLFLITITVLGWPLDISHQHLELVYGQSVQSWPSYFGDELKALGLVVVLGTLVLALFYRMIRKSPRRWWFYSWLIALPLLVFVIFLTPVVIDPMFNKFAPLEQTNPALVADLEKVVARGGLSIPPERMFLMRASEKVTSLNAYVTGIGASKRIVVWDTSIDKATPDEIMFIFGHEMGHYVLNHVYKLLAFAAIVLLVFLWLGYHAMHWLIRRFGQHWHIEEVNDYASVAVLFLTFSVFSFIAEPITNTFSRHLEHQADVYGQEAMHGLVADPQLTAQQAFQVLGELSLSDPAPTWVTIFWTYSHPDVSTRARFALKYDPWTGDGHPKYFSK
jgi:Zn-dependent protease with chaperone function